jgi:hypothetical protein
MDSRILIDAVVRQTTLLIAQLATSTGIRAPLAHLADQVFLELAQEIEQQGVSKKVAADMFGMALRTYQRKVGRLRESVSVAEKTLWQAVLEHVSQHGSVTRTQLLAAFASARAVILGSGEARFYKHAQMLFTRLPFDSAETIWSLAPTQGDGWLIGSYHMLDSSAVTASVGRYNPLRMLWSSMLQVVAPDSSWGGGDLWLGTRGNDGVLFYVGMGGVRTGRMLPGAAAGQQASLVSGEAQPLDVSTLSALSNPELDDGLRWRVSDDTAPVKTWSGAALDAPTGQAAQFQFTLGPVYPIETHYADVQDMEPSADAALLAVCHADNRINAGPPLDKLYLTVFSAAGAVRLGPLLLDEADIGVSGCRVSASNDAFLVTWRKITNAETPLDPRARIVPFPN